MFRDIISIKKRDSGVQRSLYILILSCFLACTGLNGQDAANGEYVSKNSNDYAGQIKDPSRGSYRHRYIYRRLKKIKKQRESSHRPGHMAFFFQGGAAMEFDNNILYRNPVIRYSPSVNWSGMLGMVLFLSRYFALEYGFGHHFVRYNYGYDQKEGGGDFNTFYIPLHFILSIPLATYNIQVGFGPAVCHNRAFIHFTLHPPQGADHLPDKLLYYSLSGNGWGLNWSISLEKFLSKHTSVSFGSCLRHVRILKLTDRNFGQTLKIDRTKDGLFLSNSDRYENFRLKTFAFDILLTFKRYLKT